jgi:hypothetical protein
MELKILGFVVFLDQQAWIAIFWTAAVLLAYNVAYALCILDRKHTHTTRARKAMVFLLGSLLVVGTYAQTLSAKTFALNDCLLLALIFAHGWMADELVEKFVQRGSQIPGS